MIPGTRIAVELVLRKLADGVPERQILEDFPELTVGDIRAALARAAKAVARTSASHLGAGAESAGLWRGLLGWRALLRWDVLAAIVPGSLLSVALAMLALEWVPHNLLISQLCFSLAAALLIVKTLHSATAARDKLVAKVLFCFLWVALEAGSTAYIVWVIQEHKPTAVPTVSLNAYVAPVFPVGTEVGSIKWAREYQDVRVVFKNISAYPIRNLDLTVQAAEPGEVLRGMDQSPGARIDGVELYAPQVPFPVVRLRGTNGQDYVLRPGDFGPGGLAVGEQWKVSCQEVPSGVPLRLVVAAVNFGNPNAAPSKLRLFGSYQVASLYTRFDKTIGVTR